MEDKCLQWFFFHSHQYQENVQNDSSEFEGLLHEIVSNKPYINQDTSSINGNGESKLWSVLAYIK